MNKEQIEQEISDLTNRNTEIRTIINPYETELSSNWKRIERLNDRLSAIVSSQLETEEEQIPYFLQAENGMEHYRKSQQFFDSMGFMSSGYYPETNQKCLQIVLYKDRCRDTMMKDSIKKVLPFILPAQDDTVGEVKRFGLFEHTLSEGGSYNVRYVVSTGEWQLTIMRWSRFSVVYYNTDLDAFIEYCSQNHYYTEEY
ncbi:hypothetical protein FDH34_gp088 [Serratia phage BF]|uniref:Uncharacterized protein n=2 Tax=Eneladusvirus BF TaxID=2560751 RepID=A0A7L8ZKS4_9CAUD|nr:hypothetical protein FDH34_gp088 [Serratia phage BF]AQW88613.1 hypothetical protein BF_0088 [Serratia phage BF]QOI71026.1 hypothetical protein pEaSNUABM12_00088 [Erwinia phage pEa_SNUABM_12]